MFVINSRAWRRIRTFMGLQVWVVGCVLIAKERVGQVVWYEEGGVL